MKVIPKYNLVDEPWLKCDVVDDNGRFQEKELGLREVFAQAHTLRGLAGESPAQNLAVIRMLLAILHAVYTREVEYADFRVGEDVDGAIEMWDRLYSLGKFDMEKIGMYLTKWYDRFYLFHPERPFYQVAGVDVAITDDRINSVKKMIGTISESGNTPKFSLPRNLDSLPYNEAARWLLFMNAFDDAGITKGGASWVGCLGNIYLSGSSLFETLMLNFILFDSSRSKVFWGDGEASWELDKVRDKVKYDLLRAPDSQVELLTLQSRRMFLIDKQGEVVGFKAQAGDRFAKEIDVSVEQFTKLELQTKNGLEIKEIQRLRRPQFFWRGFSSIVEQVKGSPKSVKAGTLRWLDEILNSSNLEQKDVCVNVLQAVYHDTMSMSIVDIHDDAFHINTLCLGETNVGSKGEVDVDTWLGSIERSIKGIEKLADAYGWMVYDINQARGMDTKSVKSRKRVLELKQKEQALLYSDLGTVFHTWMADIDYAVDNPTEMCKELVLTSEELVRSYGLDIYTTSGRKALEGIIKQDTGGVVTLNSIQAFNKFKNKLNQIIREGGYRDE